MRERERERERRVGGEVAQEKKKGKNIGAGAREESREERKGFAVPVEPIDQVEGYALRWHASNISSNVPKPPGNTTIALAW